MAKNKQAVTDEDAQQQRESNLLSQRQQEEEDIRFLLNTPQGMRYFKRLFSMCRLFHTSFSADSNNVILFNEGQRNIGLQIFDDVARTCPEKLATLLIKKVDDTK